MLNLTNATDVVIREPPAPPIAITTSFFSFNMIVGVIEESGRFPGSMKLAGDGGKPKMFVLSGLEKSSI